jgi:hypothetical protein
MLYLILYKSELWKKIDNKSRCIRIFVLASIIYILIHSLIYSKYVENYDTFTEYKKYIYYMILIDLTLTLIYIYATCKQNNKKKIKNKRNMRYIRYNPYQVNMLPRMNRPMPFNQNIFNQNKLNKNIPVKDNSETVTSPKIVKPITIAEIPVYKGKNDTKDPEIPIYKSIKDKKDDGHQNIQIEVQ